MSDVTIHSINLIVSDPAVKGGRPLVVGSGVAVEYIAAAYAYRKESPEQIAAGYRLTLAEVHAALAYYYQHQAEIDEQIRAAEEALLKAKEQGLGQRHPPVLR